MEPLLRGEIVFADIFGLASLSVKALAVFELLKRKPRLFIGRLPNDAFEMGDPKDLIPNGLEQRKVACDACPDAAVQKVVHFLFPKVALAEDSCSLGQGTYAQGVISNPSRLNIALQLSVTDGDVSIKASRRYLQNSDNRGEIISKLSVNNCYEFVDMLGEVGASLPGEAIDDLEETCVSIARLVDAPIFLKRAEDKHVIFSVGIDDLALQKIRGLADAIRAGSFVPVVEKIVTAPLALTCAAEILRRSYLDSRNQFGDAFEFTVHRKSKIIAAFASNVVKAGRSGVLLDINRPGFVLWTLARLAPEACPKVYSFLRTQDPSLDRFAMKFLGSSWDSTNGSAHGLPEEESLIAAYCRLDEFKAHARKRFRDHVLTYPQKAAWQSVVNGKTLYGVDGSEMMR